MVAAGPRSPRSPNSPNSPNSRATRPKTRGTTTAQVSSLGRVRTKNGKVSTPNPKASGYCSFNFNNKPLLVHRIVALLFLGPPERADQTQVDHIDGVRSNNRAVNLRWASRRENRNNETTSSGTGVRERLDHICLASCLEYKQILLFLYTLASEPSCTKKRC
jgi:hypothetical protein